MVKSALRYFSNLILLIAFSLGLSTEGFSYQEAVGYITITKDKKAVRYLVVASFEVDERGEKTGRVLSVDIVESDAEPTRLEENTIIEMRFENTPLEFVIKAIAMAADFNVIISPHLKEKFTGVTSNTDRRLGPEEFKAEYGQSRGYLSRPVNIYIQSPMKARKFLYTLLKENELIAIPKGNNTLLITKAVEYKMDITGIRGENLQKLIELFKNVVSPSAEIVIDKNLEILYVWDRVENLPKFKDIEEKMEIFYNVQPSAEEGVVTRVFYIKNRYTVDQVLNIIRTRHKSGVEVYADKQFNAIVVSATQNIIDDIEQAIKRFVKSSANEEPIVTRTFYIRFLSVDTFRELIQPLLSEVGEVYVLGANIQTTTAIEREMRQLEKQIKEYRQTLLNTTDSRLRQVLKEELNNLVQRYNKLEERLLAIKNKTGTQIDIKGFESLSSNQNATGPSFSKEKSVYTKLSNAIIVRDYLRVIERIKQTYKDLISEEPIQIKIEARVVEVDEEVLKELGVNWSALLSNSRVPEAVSGGIGVNPPSSLSLTPTLLGRPQTGGILTFVYQKGVLNALNLRLSAFERVRKAKNLSKPTVITLNGEPAVIQSSIQFPVTTLSVTQSAVTVSARYENIPLILSVVPLITPDGKIMLDITLTKKNIIDTVRYEVSAGFFQEFPVFSDSRIDTKVVVNEGDTVVIGGVINEAKSTADEGVPGIQRVPLLGWLFKEHRFNSSSKELLIFLTPTIISN